MRIKALFILGFICFGCKSVSNKKTEFINLETYATQLFDKEWVTVNPLIIEKYNPLGALDAIDLSNDRYKEIDKRTLYFIPKGLDYLTDIWGNEAKNGVILIGESIVLSHGGKSSHVLLFNGSLIDYSLIKYLDFKKFKYYHYLGNVRKKDGQLINLTIITTYE